VLKIIVASLAASLAGVMLFPLAFPTICAIGAVIVGAILLATAARIRETQAPVAS
jgi:hypothetical protein